jgi:hypothetical protein
MCSACKSIPTINSFRRKLDRRSENAEAEHDKTNFMYRSKDDLLETLKDNCKQITSVFTKQQAGPRKADGTIV